MKNFTLLIAAALTMGATASEAQTVAKSRHKARVEQGVQFGRRMVKAAVAARAQKAESQALIYLPAKQQEYLYNLDDKTWEENGTYAFTYNAAGMITRQDEAYDGEVMRTDRSWTRYNMLAEEVQSTSVDGGKTFTNVSRREQEYDYFAPSFTIRKDKYDWDEDTKQWVLNGDRYYKKVERNDDGNVTYLEIQAPYQGKLDPMERYTYTYDATTKQMTSYTYEKLGSDDGGQTFDWQPAQVVKNIRWAATDGQTFGTYEDWTSGNNRIASADIMDTENPDEKLADLTITYSANGGFTETLTYLDMAEVMISTLDFTDDNGSLVSTFQDYYDLDGDGVYSADEIAMYEKEVVTYDAHGNVTLDAFYSLPESEEPDPDEGDDESLYAARRPMAAAALPLPEPELELTGASKTDYTYDPTNGDGILSMVMSEYNYETQEYDTMMKIVTTEFTTIVDTGIASAPAAATSAPVYYNAQGMKLGSAAHGLTIVKKDGRTWKQVVK